MYDVNDARVQSYAGEGLFNRKLTYQGKTYAEYSAPTTLSYKYIYGNNEKLTRVSGSGTKTSFHHDYLGSVRRMTDASGALLWSRDYYPFGHER
mgnify:CR=1 FL=1